MKRPLEVAILVYNIDALGGMERQALNLAEHLVRRGLRVSIVSTYFPPGFGLPLPARPRLREQHGPLSIVRVPFFPWWRYDHSLRLLETVAAHVLLRRRPDVIYGVQFTTGLHAARIARILGRPTVVKFAGGGLYGDFQQIEAREDRAAVLETLKTLDCYVCPSRELQREAEKAGLDAGRTVLIRNGVNLARFARPVEAAPLPELGDARDRAVVLFVGRLGAEKRVGTLLRAFARVVERVPGARLACAGQGPLEGELRSLAATLGIADRVAFLGAVPDVAPLYRAASVFVLPSASEGLPNTVLEALAASTPTVATDISGSNDIIRHEREGLLVPVDDPPALARAIVRLLEDRDLARRLAAAGHERVASEFDMERVADGYVALFRRLAAGRATGSAHSLRFAWMHVQLLVLIALSFARIGITFAVVALKRLLGIRGDILGS